MILCLTERQEKYMSRYVADFETTVYEGQTSTEVWAAAIVEIGSSMVTVLHSIEEFLTYVLTSDEVEADSIIYFHNLKFDGSFILDYLLKDDRFKDVTEAQFKPKELKSIDYNYFNYMISAMGQWYSMNVQYNGKHIEFRDSLKLLPFSVKAIGKGFKTEHQKLDMEYEGKRYAGCEITPEEEAYIKNDVLVVKEALEYMFDDGEDGMTIGSCCMKEYKEVSTFDSTDWKNLFPDLTKISCPFGGFANADEYIRKAYKGGWCYVKKGCEGKIYRTKGTTCDVNSLYPSVMHSMSGNVYPIGKPVWFQNEIPERAKEVNAKGKPKYVYFVRFMCQFKLKKGKLPTVQIKGDKFYSGNEWLETSDYYYNGKYYDYYKDYNGNYKKIIPILTMTDKDFKLFLEHYDVTDMKILDGCYFRAVSGIFDTYIDKWAKVKMESTGAMRQLAKLFLNNLYGKFGTNSDSSYKVFYIGEDGLVHSKIVFENNKKTGYVAVAACITANARNFTIRTAQKNYDNFIYADTDSIHCICGPDDIVGAPEDPVKFCHWKYETCWDKAVFTRQKTYIEHVTHDNREPIDPYYNIKCAGMGKDAQKTLNNWLEDGTKTMADFKSGLLVPGSLKAKRIDGGVVLVSNDFVIK